MGFGRFLEEVSALTKREILKWIRTPVLVVLMVAQPALWIGLFGKAFNLTGMLRIPDELLGRLPPYVTQEVQAIFNRVLERVFGVSGIDYFSYMAVGMASVIVLFAGFSSGMSLSWDRRLGFLNKLLVAPISRSSILVSKILGGAIRAIIQAILILLIAIPLGLKLNPMGLEYVALSILGLALLAVGFSTLFISITLRVKSWETQTAVMNLLNLPIMFTSSVLYPTGIMPSWLRRIADINPLSYSADLTRQALLYGEHGSVSQVMLDLGALALTAGILLVIGTIVASKALRAE